MLSIAEGKEKEDEQKRTSEGKERQEKQGNQTEEERAKIEGKRKGTINSINRIVNHQIPNRHHHNPQAILRAI